MFEKGTRGNTLHGILLIALFSFAAFYIADIPFVKSLSLSPLIIGIILGMLYANSLRNRLPETWVPGIKFCTKQVLRTGIVLYGFRLTLADVAAVGLPAITVDAIIVTKFVIQSPISHVRMFLMDCFQPVGNLLVQPVICCFYTVQPFIVSRSCNTAKFT